ncbi:mechanosensitive ion channel family protein [Candidatus Saccharibacteria bacterium]|nr:mechanosensitive ion channel family protein [Candidatus Saccharibacteria bacterium]
MQFFEDVINNKWFQRFFWSAIVILLSFIIYHLVSKFLAAKEQKNSKIFSQKKNKTYLRMLRSIVAYGLFIFTALMVLQIFGVNVTSMLAGVGIASIVVGFALQDALKDIIRGLDIISGNYYNVGDIIKFNNNTGQVLSISLRTTKIQDINSMNIVSIANRDIDEVEVVSEYIYLTVPLPYEMKVDAAEDILDEMVKKLKKHEDITSAAYQGITDIATSSMNYQIAITCDPTVKLQTRRDALGIIVTTLEAHRITIPYTQLDIHARRSK